MNSCHTKHPNPAPSTDYASPSSSNSSTSSEEESQPPIASSSLSCKRKTQQNAPCPSNEPSNRGLSYHVEKQLLKDIESSGGIEFAILGSIINAKPLVYGAKHTKKRKKVQNRYWNYLKRLSSLEYTQLIDSYGIQQEKQEEKPPSVPTSVLSLSPTPSKRQEHFTSPSIISQRRLQTQFSPISPSAGAHFSTMFSHLTVRDAIQNQQIGEFICKNLAGYF